MSFAMNGKTRIRYEVDGQGSPLVLAHGGTVGLEMWEEIGYTDALRSEHRLVLFDVRGHGGSDKPHDPSGYSPELMAGDVLAVLDDLGIVQAHYLGASLGAAIGFELARRAPQRLQSLTLLGYGKYGPLTEAQRQFHDRGLQMMGLGATMGGAAVLAGLERAGARISPVMAAAFQVNDWQALLAMQTAFLQWPGLEDDLPQMATPALLIAAEGDPFFISAQQCAAKMPNAKFVSLAGGFHGQDSYLPRLVVPHFREFLAGLAHHH